VGAPVRARLLASNQQLSRKSSRPSGRSYEFEFATRGQARNAATRGSMIRFHSGGTSASSSIAE
jgi:hypothetical protein